MAIFKALTFDGVNSLDYGIYITGEAVYNAPERAVEMVNIPGKNGALALDQGRFENIEVTYHAGCFADNQADFADKVMKFRNALASRYTYKRLTDEYHSDEYRLGLYKSGLDVDAVRYGTAGEFNIVFDCKPQRFLVDGDRAISPTEWSDVQTESGELVTIESDGSLAVRSLEAELEPIQEGSGTPSPDNVRPISGRTEVVTIVSPTTDAEDGTTYTTSLGQTVYGGTLDVVSGELVVDRVMTTDWSSRNFGTFNEGSNAIEISTVETLLKAGQTNIISDKFKKITTGWSNVAEFGIRVRANVGELIFKFPKTVVSNVSDGKQWMIDNNVQVVYELATPQTIQLSPQQVQLLLGDNNVWSDVGEITVTYGVHPYYNPTPFESKPLIKVTGTGTLGIGAYILTITGSATQTLYIDCETMEIYTIEGTVPTGASSLVSINKNDFPVLKPGINNISVGSGITAVTITPRWWRI